MRSSNLLETLKQYTFPIAALLYLLGSAAKLNEYAEKLGWRLVSIAAFGVATAWAVYVWLDKKPDKFDPSSYLPAFGRGPRVIALVVAIGTLVPVWFSIQPVPEFRIPSLAIRVTNPTKVDVALARYGEFFLTAPQTPVMDVQVAAGRLSLRENLERISADDSIIIRAGKELDILAEFLNPKRFEATLKAREIFLRVVIHQSDGTMLTRGGIPFDADVLASSYVTIEVKPKEN